MRIAIACAVAVAVIAGSGTARADDCLDTLDRLGVGHKRAQRGGVAIGVEITTKVGGVDYIGSGNKSLVIDCSLAVSLAEAGRYLVALGIERATFTSAYARRNVRGTSRPSKHSFGLAIDVSVLSGADAGTLRVDHDYEQGLGDAVDCIGRPLTRGGALLKIAQCQLVHSGLFHLVLSPDYDDAHHDHFHLEARPWKDRPAVRVSTPAIH